MKEAHLYFSKQELIIDSVSLGRYSEETNFRICIKKNFPSSHNKLYSNSYQKLAGGTLYIVPSVITQPNLNDI